MNGTSILNHAQIGLHNIRNTRSKISILFVRSSWFFYLVFNAGGEGWLGFPDLLSCQKPWWNWCLTPVANFGEVRRAQLAKSTLLTSPVVPLGSFKVCSDSEERVGCGKQREATAPIKSLVKLQPWFLSLRWKTCLRQNCSLGFSACSENLPLGGTLWWWFYALKIESLQNFNITDLLVSEILTFWS